jgi:hypothetical protein
LIEELTVLVVRTLGRFWGGIDLVPDQPGRVSHLDVQAESKLAKGVCIGSFEHVFVMLN